MTKVVWNIIRHNERLLLAQRSFSDVFGGTWVPPGGKVDTEDRTLTCAANRELKEEVGLKGRQSTRLSHIVTGNYKIYIFYHNKWSGDPKPMCDDIIGVGWFTISEMYALGGSIAPLVNSNLMYLAYIIQNHENAPREQGRWWLK